jgi:hypothetical protein
MRALVVVLKFRVLSEFLLLTKFTENKQEKNSEKTREHCCLSPGILPEYHSEFRDKFRENN